MERTLLSWTPSQNIAIVEIVDTLVQTNSDVLKRDIFKIALEMFNEQFGTNRTFIAFKNHYYDIVREKKEEKVVEEAMEVEEIILQEEKTDIVSYMEGIMNSYEKIRDENKRLIEENEILKSQMTDKLGDYDALLRVIERARAIMINEELGTAQKQKFKMESNGNLVIV